MKIDLNKLLRPNIRQLKPYSSARNEFKGEASVFLDANENPFNPPYNRYPDPLQWEVKEKIAQIKGVSPENILLGVGSDEPIDLLFRAFCRPGINNVVAIDPTYGMYKVCADINDVEYRPVVLNEDFDFSPDKLLDACDENTKLIFLCSPNNPTGNALSVTKIVEVLTRFSGIVIVDEAYIDFSSQPSFLKKLNEYPNLVVLQTFSKAWGSAGIRLGMAFASSEIISIFNKIKYPYNINKLTQEHALILLSHQDQVRLWVKDLIDERNELARQLAAFSFINKIYPSDANFLLVKTNDAQRLYNYLVTKGIIVRNRSNITLCMGCIRITVGTSEENQILLDALKEYTF
ncbi:histidinol-phosphate transaminase [Coprobacter secundus]|uniref:Histidinol-phosphate aminotransferase n=1 Tax=Coprobacter secundus subsp. similis TaxID=2751153 RepID=A0A7G1I0E8_9BACT|nr:histidinol-phosphate transaminase [Coprobacter secundus]BCI63207.1 histidinol-phosphate aminotransferase [Coprobacter secundus subsp. similis]CCY38703.1 histidinol-phosphate aminotransferase [Tannerella sp. CAG:118]